MKSYADTLVIHADRLDEAKKREFAEVISQEVDRLAASLTPTWTSRASRRVAR